MELCTDLSKSLSEIVGTPTWHGNLVGGVARVCNFGFESPRHEYRMPPEEQNLTKKMFSKKLICPLLPKVK